MLLDALGGRRPPRAWSAPTPRRATRPAGPPAVSPSGRLPSVGSRRVDPGVLERVLQAASRRRQGLPLVLRSSGAFVGQVAAASAARRGTRPGRRSASSSCELVGVLRHLRRSSPPPVVRGSAARRRRRPAARRRRAAPATASAASPASARRRRWRARRRRAAPRRSGPAARISRAELEHHVAQCVAEDRGARRPAVPPWAPIPGTSSGPLMARSSSVPPMVAPTTAPKEPSGVGPGVERAQPVEHGAGDGAAAGGAGVLDLAALRVGGQGEHEDARRRGARAVSTIGSSEPKPRYGLAVIASTASGEAGRGRRRRSAWAVEPMSPRLTSRSTSAPAARARRRPARGQRCPRQPNRSKNADCGLTRRDTRRQRLDRGQRELLQPGRRRRSRPQASSSAACGSIPAHSGPRWSIAARRRAPKAPLIRGPWPKRSAASIRLG